jgi:RNA polymerase sigma-70 factor, ECF subfamily
LLPPAEAEDATILENIDRARRGDLVAFNQLVDRYQQRAFNVALRMLGNADEAADVTQDAFIAAMRAIRRFRGMAFRVWLLRIVTNQCLDALRARKRHPHVALNMDFDTLDDGTTTPAQLLFDDSWDPEMWAERRELHDLLEHSLLMLPADQRIAVILSDVEGMSYDEIAAIVRAPLGTIKSRIARGRSRLRELLLRQRELLPRPYRLKGESTDD